MNLNSKLPNVDANIQAPGLISSIICGYLFMLITLGDKLRGFVLCWILVVGFVLKEGCLFAAIPSRFFSTSWTFAFG